MFELLEHLPYCYCVGLLLQGQFNYVNIVIKPLDYESNAVVLQAKEGKSWQFCLFYFVFYVPSTIIQLCRDGSSCFEPVLSYDKCVLLKDIMQ